MLGFWDGYVEEEPVPVNLTGEIRIHGRAINFPTAEATSRSFFSPPKLWPEKGQPWDDDGSMDDDEYI